MANQILARRYGFIVWVFVFLACALRASPSADQTFTAQLTYPTAGAAGVDTSHAIQWTAVAAAQCYYLYLGTTVGAKDLVDSGEVHTTSYAAPGLPASRLVFARLWTNVQGIWRFADSSFTVGSSVPTRAVLTTPTNGAVNVDPTLPMRWTAVPNARAYYLYVGSTPGANNLVNTGEILQTSYVAASLPAGATVFARLWTKVASGQWQYVDITFAVAVPAPLPATLIFPANGARNVDQAQAARWNVSPNAEWYYLYVGSTLGAKDIVDSGGTHFTTFPIAFIPSGQTLYARLWTKVANGPWLFTDGTFSAAPIAPTFAYPTDGAVAVDGSRAFSWIPPGNAQSHRLLVGSTPGGGDLFDSGLITATSAAVGGLPSKGVLYARVLSSVNGVWKHTDIGFSLAGSSEVAAISVPSDGQIGFDTMQPFAWSAVPLARGYRLRIGRAPGGSDLHDSGEIQVTRRFVPKLPTGRLFGKIETKIDGQWYAADFTFSVGGNTETSTAFQVESALWATDFVRGMALSDNRPFTWTEVAEVVRGRHVYRALCVDYTQALLRVLVEVNLQLPARRLDITLNSNNYDAHTLVEMFNRTTGSWMILDPTFDLTVKRTIDGGYATAEDVSAATNIRQWDSVRFEFVGPLGNYYARNYYLDPAILYVNIFRSGQAPTPGVGGPVMPFMAPVSMPIDGSRDVYAIGCTGAQTVTLLIDGAESVVDCGNVDGLSHVFGAKSVAPTAHMGAAVSLYRPRRFVF